MGIFNKKVPVQIQQPIPVQQVPEAAYEQAEAKVEQQAFNAPQPVQTPEVQYASQIQKSVPQTPLEPQKPKIIQVPVYLSEQDINNMVIENNLMLKELLNLASQE